jgi:tyrosine-protein phosphatase SIW14
MGQSCRFVSVALLAATTCATPSTVEATKAFTHPGPSKAAVARELRLSGVPHFGQATPTLYRGGQPTKQGFQALAKMGINIVVDARGSREREREEVTGLGMEYVAIPWHCPYPKDKPLARFLALLRENPEKKVFVHCLLGDDRTGMMIAAYRMAEQGWTAEEAKREMEADGFALSHHVFCPGLSSYEHTFLERFRTSPAFRELRTANH